MPTPAVVPTPIPLPTAQTSRLRIGLDRDPSSLDPAIVTDAAGRLVVGALFDSLTRMSADLSDVRPAAAQSWEVDDTGLVWTFAIAPATWHDGMPVTAQQFVRGFTHVATGAGDEAFNAHLLSVVQGWEETRATGAPLAGVQAMDAATLRITLQRPMGDLPALVSHPALAPRRLGGVDVRRPVGNGPFAMTDAWAQNQFIRVEAVTDHRRFPGVGEIVFLIYAQAGSDVLQYEDFRGGVLDVARVPPGQLGDAADEFGRSSDGHTGPGLLDGVAEQVYYFGFNASTPPLDDAAIRRGLSHLLDRDEIVEDVVENARRRADGLVAPSIPGGGVVECAACTHDPALAAGLLADIDGQLSEPLRILTLEGTTNRRIAAGLANAIRDAVDVQVVVEARPPHEWVQRLQDSDLQVFRGGWEATWPTMGGVLEPLFHSRNVGITNLVRIADADLDEMIDAAMAKSGPGAIPSWQRVERAILDRALVAPVFFEQLNMVVREDVVGFAMAPTGAVDLAAVTVDDD